MGVLDCWKWYIALVKVTLMWQWFMFINGQNNYFYDKHLMYIFFTVKTVE